MGYKNTDKKYGAVSKFFHWTTALMIFVLLIVGFTMHGITGEYKYTVYGMHKTSGIILMILVIARAIWMLVNPAPKLPNTNNSLIIYGTKIFHYLFYVLLLVMPISGWVMACAHGHPPKIFGEFSMAIPFVERNLELAATAHTWHAYSAWGLIGFIAIHVLGALKHHFIDRDEVLIRMLPKKMKSLFSNR